MDVRHLFVGLGGSGLNMCFCLSLVEARTELAEANSGTTLKFPSTELRERQQHI